MLRFGVIAEGPTDQTVIENILLGYFEDYEDEPDVRYIQPPRPLTEKPGGWGHVFRSLERKDHEGALQYNAYEEASSRYRKRKTLIAHHARNPSLELFIKQLETLQSRLKANDLADSQEPRDAAPSIEKPPGNIPGEERG